MMTQIESILLFCNGAALALLVADWWTRRRLEAKLTKAETEMREVLAKVQESHNGLAKEVLACQNQISAHEFRLAGRSPGSTQWKPSGTSASP